MFIRKISLIVMSLTLLFSLTGCMSAGDEVSATAAPTLRPVVTAEATAAASRFDWNTGAQDVEKALEQLSEVESARVAISGNTALVGVKFDSAYKGQLTERIRDMVAGVVKKADPSIERVAVTSDENDVNQLFAFSERVRAGANETWDDFKDDVNTIIHNATTM